jgi:hypothetical protein
MPFIEIMPLVNGEEYSWSQIAFNFAAAPVVGIRGIKYGTKQEKANIYGAGSNAVSRGRGRREYSCSVTLLGSTVVALQKQAQDGDITRIKPFPITVVYQPEGSPLVTVTIEKFEFKGLDWDWKEGDMSKDIDLEGVCGKITTKVG